MLVIALDQSTTATGYSVNSNGTILKSGVFKPSKRKGTTSDTRCYEVAEFLRDLIVSYEPDLVAMEGIWLAGNAGYGTNVATHNVLGNLMGMIKYVCLDLEVQFEVIAPATWKAGFGILGNTRLGKNKREDQKARAIGIAKLITGKEASEDESEAILISEYARRTLE